LVVFSTLVTLMRLLLRRTLQLPGLDSAINKIKVHLLLLGL